jgi:acyl-lipid omega-6 desaturase (Delta-12 desaturase)
MTVAVSQLSRSDFPRFKKPGEPEPSMTLSLNQPQIESKPSIAAADLKLRDILNTLPRNLFLKDSRKAWTQVFLSIFMVAAGYVAITYAPIYLLPFAWIFTGTALTGFFVVGHDCGHRSFSNKKWVNNLVGHLAFLPLIYPFHGWRIGHNFHHKHTNKLDVDNAWQPWKQEVYQDLNIGMKAVYHSIRGKLWWTGSIFHWALVNFDWTRCTGREREQMRFSTLFVVIGGGIGLTALTFTTGWWGLVKFWLIPWLVYHFWMSTFTVVHHTARNIPFAPAAEWNEAIAQLTGTVHCDYPKWIEVLCHDINVHLPHHISTAIPSYHLREAHQLLKEQWHQYGLQERTFNWELMKEITEECHLYDPEDIYLSFGDFRAAHR